MLERVRPCIVQALTGRQWNGGGDSDWLVSVLRSCWTATNIGYTRRSNARSTEARPGHVLTHFTYNRVVRWECHRLNHQSA
jgi:hypothetical protein